jgi:predicted PolB exonuclease-like 3'-5' exonuclease
MTFWDIETIPDVNGFAAADNLLDKTAAEVRAAMGDKFPKHIYHSIICIGALIAHHDGDHWVVDALGAPHVGERSEEELIASFVDRIAELAPQLVTFNGSSFDLLSYDTAQWSTKCLRLVCQRDRTGTGTPMTQWICVTFCLRFRRGQNQHYTSYAA